jgi:hypothetical protein
MDATPSSMIAFWKLRPNECLYNLFNNYVHLIPFFCFFADTRRGMEKGGLGGRSGPLFFS